MSTVESNQTLKNQFQQLQEKQQKKLLRRKQLQDEKGKGDRRPSEETDPSSAFGINDNLDLKLSDPAVKSSGIYSEELVSHLNDQLRELKDESGRLYKLLSERDLEVRQLRKKQQDNKAAITGSTSGSVSNDTAATKIVDLSKKVRELNSELESEKTKSKQLAKKCLNLENELDNAIYSKETQHNSSTTASKLSLMEGISDRHVLETELKNLHEKMKHTDLKMVEYRNQTQSLKQEIKVANKVLAQEVGDGCTIQSLMSSSSNWRGRAQQIVTLQKKVNELRYQLDQATLTSRVLPDDEFMSSASSRTSRNPVEERHKEKLRNLDREKKEAQEKTALELKVLEQDHDSLKQRMEASKARNKVLSTELRSVKQQIQKLLEKGKHDDELIEALLKQQSQLKAAFEKNTKNQKETSDQQHETKKQLDMKTQQENNVIEQLRVIVADKEIKVKELEEEIKHMRLQRAQISGAQGLFENESTSNRGSVMSDYQASYRPSTAGTSRPPTVLCDVIDDCGTLTPTPSARDTDTRSSSRQSTQDRKMSTDRPSSRKHSARPNSANRTDKMVVEELLLQCQEYKSMCQAATVERDRLTELVQVLNKRIDEGSHNATEYQSEIINQRRKNAQLEKQLGKAKVEYSQAGKKPKSKTGASATGLRDSVHLGDDVSASGALDELETSLAIQKDENEALKVALQTTLQSKQEDLILYNEMIEETKKVFLQGLRQYRAQSGHS